MLFNAKTPAALAQHHTHTHRPNYTTAAYAAPAGPRHTLTTLILTAPQPASSFDFTRYRSMTMNSYEKGNTPLPPPAPPLENGSRRRLQRLRRAKDAVLVAGMGAMVLWAVTGFHTGLLLPTPEPTIRKPFRWHDVEPPPAPPHMYSVTVRVSVDCK